MNEKAQGLLILIAVVGTVGGAYALAWRGKSPAVRRGASWVVAVIFAVAGLWGLWAYAIPILLEGLHDPSVPRWVAVIVGLVIAAICVLPWSIAVRFAKAALRKESSSQASAAPSPEASPSTKP
jgi:tetrahydromethanopterin S-methyltransferase subunit D